MTLDQAFTDLPALETGRMRLRSLRKEDADELFEIKSDLQVTERYGQDPHRSIEDTQRWIQNRLEDYKNRDAIFYIFTLKGGDRAIGSCCYWNFEPSFRCAEIAMN